MVLMGASETWASSSLQLPSPGVSGLSLPGERLSFDAAARFVPRRSSSRLVWPLPLVLLGLSSCRACPLLSSFEALALSARRRVGWNPVASPLVSFTSPSKTHRIACGPCPRVGLSGSLAGPCPPLLVMSTLSWGSQSSSLRRHTLQESTPTAPPQQAGREGFGRGMPCPRRVPSSSFLTTSTACSSWALRASRTRSRPWDSSRFRPVRALFLPGPRSLSPRGSFQGFPARPIRIGVSTPSSLSRAARRPVVTTSLLTCSPLPRPKARSLRAGACLRCALTGSRQLAGPSPEGVDLCAGSCELPRGSCSPASTRSLLPRLPRQRGYARVGAPRRRTGGRSRGHPSSPRAPHPRCGSERLPSFRSPVSWFLFHRFCPPVSWRQSPASRGAARTPSSPR